MKTVQSSEVHSQWLLGLYKEGSSESKQTSAAADTFLNANNILSIQLNSSDSFLSPSVLERKMSTRQSREELIKKGVLKEVYEKGERQENGF